MLPGVVLAVRGGLDSVLFAPHPRFGRGHLGPERRAANVPADRKVALWRVRGAAQTVLRLGHGRKERGRRRSHNDAAPTAFATVRLLADPQGGSPGVLADALVVFFCCLWGSEKLFDSWSLASNGFTPSTRK